MKPPCSNCGSTKDVVLCKVPCFPNFGLKFDVKWLCIKCAKGTPNVQEMKQELYLKKMLCSHNFLHWKPTCFSRGRCHEVKMAMFCKKCKGIIPDVCFDGDRIDCDNHIKPEVNIFPGLGERRAKS